MSALTDLRHNTLVTMVRTWLGGEPVGADEFGNRYYRARGAAGDRRAERRWVVYAGPAEPTRVPPGWHGWVRGTIERPPSERPLPAPRWEADPMPNLTGTPGAYYPPGSLRRTDRGGRPEAPGGEYEAWRP
ncbi:MAG TPA: NADH-ubiquinone oxidoreductase subunit NDUFA12 family protein [Geminicoccaceae bacterium]|nr:NADH-ubiquinone oxidoreductase subunit NDUFA12 family protein [Geminicoccaceae bacterium]